MINIGKRFCLFGFSISYKICRSVSAFFVVVISCMHILISIGIKIYSIFSVFQHFHSVREHKSVRRNEFKARAGYQSFDPLLHARFFRLRIHAWRRHPCLSMELYGCESRK